MQSLIKLKQIRLDEQNALDQLKTEILGKLDASYIAEICQKLDVSKNLTQAEHDDLYHVFVQVDLNRFDIDFKDEDQVNALEFVLEDHDCLRLDVKNDCVTRNIGPCIVINDDGDVFDQDSNKWIISKNDYENQEELMTLIESYMEETGCYPPIISSDYYGNANFLKL